ncbi:hypothetical protein BC443_11980 [Salinicola sp. MIT1003]|nr:hypothetical protein BC443_11980 [Salinicola sp. MIT1003]
MSMLEREIQDVELDGVDTAEVDSDDTGRKDDESAFEKALSREENSYHHSLDATQMAVSSSKRNAIEGCSVQRPIS